MRQSDLFFEEKAYVQSNIRNGPKITFRYLPMLQYLCQAVVMAAAKGLAANDRRTAGQTRHTVGHFPARVSPVAQKGLAEPACLVLFVRNYLNYPLRAKFFSTPAKLRA